MITSRLLDKCLFCLLVSLSVEVSGLDDAFSIGNSIVQPNQIALDIYVDETGRALLTGYAKEIAGLLFLNPVDYRYNNDTGQLYALTNSLTSKQGDNWTLDFRADGNYNQYHTTFFLPNDLKLRKINCSAGLEYLVYASNNSFIADIQGYDLQDPMTSIMYTLTLEEPPFNGGASKSIYLPIALLVVMSFCAIIIFLHKRGSRLSDVHMPDTINEDDESGLAKPFDKQDEKEQYADIIRPEDSLKATGIQPKSSRKEIEVTREMEAIMETLTAREQAVIQALIKNGGDMNQTELRYETSMPKSTLSGVLLSLERRKLIKKKEWGRTNVIELSEWFLAKRD